MRGYLAGQLVGTLRWFRPPAGVKSQAAAAHGTTRSMTSSSDSPRPPTSVYLGPLVPPVERLLCAPIAQQAERLHGKEKVCGSIPHGGSDSVSGATAHRRNMRSIQIVARPGKLVAETTAG
jgi:hypothetical protein